MEREAEARAKDRDHLRLELNYLREAQKVEAEEVKIAVKNKQEADIQVDKEENKLRDYQQDLFGEQAKREEISRELSQVESEEAAISRQIDDLKQHLSQSPQRVK